jgi:aldehyde:ferredoxin oxidoreductase
MQARAANFFDKGETFMPYGYTGKILHVDLSNRKMEIEEPDEAFYRSYLGGRGFGYHYLMKNVPAGIDPFAPENILVLATGIMTGAPLPAACRFTAAGKSPLTGSAGESEAAGFFGPELKMAGFDAVVFQGKSESPVYLWVTAGKAGIKDAAHFAQSGTREVEDIIHSQRSRKQKNPGGSNRTGRHE